MCVPWDIASRSETTTVEEGLTFNRIAVIKKSAANQKAV